MWHTVVSRLLLVVFLAGLVDAVPELAEVEVELQSAPGAYHWQIIEDAHLITEIEELESSGCEGNNTKYGFIFSTVWSAYGCYVKMKVQYVRQSTVLCLASTMYGTEEDTEQHKYVLEGVGQIASVEVDEAISSVECVFKKTFWYNGNFIVTKGGCKAFFVICYLQLSFQCMGCDDPKIYGFDHSLLGLKEPCMYNFASTNFHNHCSFRILVKVYTSAPNTSDITYVEIHEPDLTIKLDKHAVQANNVDVGDLPERYNKIYVNMPAPYATTVTGLCGNGNCYTRDDLQAPNGMHLDEYVDKKEGCRAITLQHIVDDTSEQPNDLAQCQVPK